MDDKSPPSEGGALAMKCRLEAGAFSETRLLLLRKLQLSELHCKLGWLFNLRGQHYQLKYLDKYGDLITFSSEEEFQLALANYLQPEFRVLITPAAEALPAAKWRKAPAGAATAVKSVAFSDVVDESDSRAGQLAVVEAVEKRPVQMKSQPAEKSSTAEEAATLRLAPKPATTRRLQAGAGGAGGGGGGFTNGGIAAKQRQQQRRSVLKHRQRSPCWEAPAATYQPAQPPPRPPPLPIASDDFVHHGIVCNRCGSDPLIGWRFKCSRCPNYNLCSTCFDTYSHGHGFYRLP